MKTGRPTVPGEKRTKLIGFYLTESDKLILEERAKEGGFKSTSALVTALIEPIIRAGFSIKGGVDAISLVQSFMVSNGVKFKPDLKLVKQAVFQLFSPPPPMIPDEVRDISQLKKDLREYLDGLDEMENQTEPQIANK